MIKLGVIGLGNRIRNGVMPSLLGYSDEFVITDVYDSHRALVEEEIAKKEKGYAENIRWYDSPEELVEKADVDGVMIGTRCSSHTKYAILAMKMGVPIFLEKPVSTSMEDLRLLAEANRTYQPKVVVSFPLRFSKLSTFSKELIESGKIGEVWQVDAFNDVPYGRVYYHRWYRDEKESNGLWLQKATHDFDYINYILGDKAEEVFARWVKKIFKGDMPAGQKCTECEKYKTCIESPFVLERECQDQAYGDMCCFAVDTGNEDCGNALLKYKKGTIVSYAQNFFARHKAARRGARFYGFKGTLEFDWYKSEIKVYQHHCDCVETYSFAGGGGHFGGDEKLAELYYKQIKGIETKSYLEEGIESALMCLMAKESCETSQNIVIPEV